MHWLLVTLAAYIVVLISAASDSTLNAIKIKVCGGFSDGGFPDDCCAPEAAGIAFGKLAWDAGKFMKPQSTPVIELDFEFIDVAGDAGKAISCAYSGWYEEDKALVLGGGWSSLSLPIAQVGKTFEGAQLDWGGTSDQLSDVDSFPYFARAVAPDGVAAIGIAELMASPPPAGYNVTRLIVFHDTDVWGNPFKASLVEALRQINKDIDIRIVPLDGAEEQLRNRFRELKGLLYRSHVLVSMNPMVFNILAEPEFNYILGPEFLHVAPADLLVGFEGINASTQKLYKGLQICKPGKEAVDHVALSEFWKSLKPQDFPAPLDKWIACDGGTASPKQDCWWGGEAIFTNLEVFNDTYFSAGFDAAWLAHSAAQNLTASGYGLADIKGPLLYQAITSLPVNSITGRIKLLPNGDRVQTMYDIQYLNEEAEFKTVGHYDALKKVLTFTSAPVYADGTNMRPADSFEACPHGSYREGKVCTVADKGFYVPEGWLISEPLPCPEGQHNIKTGSTSCLPCLPGSFANESKSSMCKLCPLGRAQAAPGHMQCSACEPGTFADVLGSSMCKECAVGTFQSSNGSSACLPCGPRETTLQMTEVAGKSIYILFSGASSEDDCGCEVGFRPQGDSCVDCVEGLDCRGKSDIWVKEGFSAGRDLSVFKCHNNHLRCQEGRPGASCATNRVGISCAECALHTAPQDDGTCIMCEGPDRIIFVLIALLFAIALVFIYWVIATKDHTKTNHAALFCALNMSITVTLVQQIGVISFVSLEWPEPLGTFLSVVRLLNFDIEVLRFSCVVSAGPFERFVIKICILAIGIVALLIIHSCFVIIKRKGDFKRNRYALIGSLGTLFMVFYISVVSTVIAPLQCVSNPNGKWTVRGYQSVQCWTSEGDHTSMVVLGLLALLGSLGYLTHCCLAVRRYPKEMRAGHVTFLRSYAFLFSRYRSELYWYPVIHMFRSLLLSLVPVVPHAVVQIFGLQIITISHFALVIVMKPWRVMPANVLEGVFASGILLMLTVGAIAIEEASLRPVAWVGVVLILSMFSCMPVCLGYAAYAYFAQQMVKPFHFFICHHKAGAGCFARLLKLVLSAHTKVRKKVFIDCDDLLRLDVLFDYVGFQSDICVIVCSKEILSRQWCMGEIVTAKRQNTSTTRVLWNDFVEPTPEYIDSYEENVDISGLAEHGISLSMVQDALRWVPTQHKNQLAQSLSEKTVSNLADTLVQTGSLVSNPFLFAFEPDNLNPNAQIAILVDNSNCETQSSALVLKRYLLKFTSHSPDQIPFLLPDDAPAPKSTKIALIMCTAGALQQPNFLKALISAGQLQNKYVPILANESFRFPTSRFLEESKAIVDSVTDQPEQLLSLILSVFKSIAVVFQPEVYSSTEEILQTQASQIAARLGNARGSLPTLRFPVVSRQEALASDDAPITNKMLAPATLLSNNREDTLGTVDSYDMHLWC